METGHQSKGIVILGFPRSGTTLLQRLLGAHTKIDAPGETYLLSSCARFIKGQTVVDGLEANVCGGVSLLGLNPDDVEDGLRRLVFDLRSRRMRRLGKARWAEKTAIDAFHAINIHRIFGDRLTYVFVVRHALDVCVSTSDWCAHLESYPDEIHRYIVRHPNMLEAFAHAWVDVMASFRQLIDTLGTSAFIVRYETLVSEPEGVLHLLLDHLGESWEEGMIERAFTNHDIAGFGDWKIHARQGVDETSVERWRGLSRGTLKKLAPIVNPQLLEWGYDPIDVAISESQADALRRYTFSLLFHSARTSTADSSAEKRE